MIMKTRVEADKLCIPKDVLNAKKLGYFHEIAGFHVVQPIGPTTLFQRGAYTFLG